MSFAFLLSTILAAHAQPEAPVRIGNATSPNGKYILEALVAGGGQKSRIEIKNLPAQKVVGELPETDFDTEGVRYAVSAVWNEDSTAFALNIAEGRNSTFCRVFVEVGETWKEADLPEEAIERVRTKATRKGAREQEYLTAHKWTSPKKLTLHFQGNTGEVYQLNCRLTGDDKPRLRFLETIAPKANE